MFRAMVVVVVACMVAAVNALDVRFLNLCPKDMILSDGKKHEKIKQGDNVQKTLVPGDIKAYRFGKGNQATLAEFSIDNQSTTWYDIGIIPVGPKGGPEQCTSLEDCKSFTGGVGFNVPMKIVPHLEYEGSEGDHCRTLTCLADGCEDAYHFPHDVGKTHDCPGDVNMTVVFCATGSTGSSESSLGWEEAGVIAKTAFVAATPAPSPESSPPSTKVSTRNDEDEDDGTSVAVVVASIVGGFIIVFATIILARRFRHKALERSNRRRYSSEAVMFVEVNDDAML